MPRRTLLAALLTTAAFATLSGCVECVEGPPVTARGIVDAPSSSGALGHTLVLHVTDGPGGPALPGAGVVVYYGRVDASEWEGPRVEVRPDLVLVEPVNATRTVESKTVVRLMTDMNGLARARVPEARIVGVVAAMEGFTEEWIPALATGESGAESSLTFPLYRARVAADMDAVWNVPAGASTGFATSSDYAWDAHDVPFADSADANRGYAARIVEMTVTLEWSNSPMGAGDLGIGIGPPAEGPRYFADASENLAAGAQAERATVALQELREHDILGAPIIQAGAATDTAFVAPFGLPYAMRVEALFDTARASLAACSDARSTDDNAGVGASVPGQGALAAVLSLCAAALVAARGGRGASRGGHG